MMQGKINTLHQKLMRRELSAVELADKYLTAVAAYDNTLHSYVEVTAEQAREAAKQIDRKIAAGEEIGLLEGIPMAVKDCISTKGVLTSCGSKILSNYKPVYDAFVVEQLKAAGAVMLGKTNMDEFAMGSTCESSWYGPTKNPFSERHVPGGSSGGAAASVGADLAVYGLGSDTGGSVRQPASFCGTVGLKPTYGSVSRFGLIAYASSLDQIGVLAQGVEDAAIVYDVIAKYDCRDATCSNHQRISTVEALHQPLKGRKIGVLTNLFEGLNVEIDTCLQSVITELRSQGAEIFEITIPQFELALPVYYILACAEASSNLARYDGVRYGYRAPEFEGVEDMIVKTRDQGFGVEVKRRIMLGNYVLSSGYFDAYYKRAQRMREVICQSFSEAFSKVDLLLSPTVASTAFELGQLSDPVSMYLTDLCTVTVNICGLPAVSVPCGYDKEGLPVGLQLIGNKFCEHTVLNAAYQYEQAAYQTMYRKPVIGGDTVAI